MKLYGAGAVLKDLENHVYGSTKELAGLGIGRVKDFIYDFKHPYGDKPLVWISPSYFPFSKSDDMNQSSGIAGYDSSCTVSANLRRTCVSTELFNNERDYLLLAPKAVQMKALQTFREEIATLKLYSHLEAPAQGAIDNIKRNMSKLSRSLSGKAQKVEMYDYVRDTMGLSRKFIQEYSLDSKSSKYSEERLKSREYTPGEMADKVIGHIEDGRSFLKEVEVKKVSDARIFTPKISGTENTVLDFDTSPNMFPFWMADDVRTPGSTDIMLGRNMCVTVYVTRGKVALSADVPFERAELLLGLPDKLRGRIIEERGRGHSTIVYGSGRSCRSIIVDYSHTKDTNLKFSILRD